MSIEEENFKNHLKAVAEAASLESTTAGLDERPLTLDELKELALSMGLTEDGWNDLQKKAVNHLKAADDHLRVRNWDDAILEAEQATAINPYIENGNAVLARAYLMKWLETHENEHRDKAAKHARKELAVDPKDQMAVNVLNTINKKDKVISSERNSKKTIILALGGILLVAAIAFFFLRQSGNAEEKSGIKNQLIEAEEDVYAKWDLVQVAISQRNAMIPDLFQAVQTNTSETEKLNNAIEELQIKIDQSEGEERFKLENELSVKISEMKKIVKSNGDASAVEKLLIQIEGSENRIAFEKKNYNEAVKTYNVLVKQNQEDFPQFETKPYFNEK